VQANRREGSALSCEDLQRVGLTCKSSRKSFYFCAGVDGVYLSDSLKKFGLIGFEISRQSNVLGGAARWHIFKPKVPIWVNFGGSCNGRYWYILWPFGQHILQPFGIFVPIWYIFSRIGIFFQVKSGNPGSRWEARQHRPGEGVGAAL
jgi:hypothetical protein